MLNAAIVHNHPIHYQHLLFTELARRGLEFEVLYTASRSVCRIETPAPASFKQSEQSGDTPGWLRGTFDLRSRAGVSFGLSDNPAASGSYPARIGFDGDYEHAPALGAARFVWSSLSAVAPRVLVVSGYCDAAAWTAWLWARLHRVPILLWSESNSFDHPRVWWKERLKRCFVAGCEAASVYGESNCDYLLMLGMPPFRIQTGRVCLDTRLFSRALPRVRPRHKLLLYVGRFSPEKNLAALIRAFAEIEQDQVQPDLVLAFAGYGPQEKELRRIVDAEGVSQTVRFLGPAKQRELPRIYRNADAFVLPSLREPWGIVAAEAMACGLPVLVSRQCGCARDLVFPNTGWTFSPGDHAGLVAALRHIAASPREVLDAMGDHAADVAARYSPQICADLVLGSIQRLVLEAAERRRMMRISPSVFNPR